MADSIDLFGKVRSPQTQDEWDAVDYHASQLFTPHAPIDEEQLFVGRIRLVEALLDTVFQKGQHAILYGERGVGKTSLANVIQTKVFSRSKRYRIIKRNCTKRLRFKQIWTQLLDDMSLEDGRPLSSELGPAPGPYEVLKAIARFHDNMRPIFIIDEYDRVLERATHDKMADLIKYLSDQAIDATVIIIGVAGSVKQLFGGHPSIERNVKQVAMPLMSEAELHLIFDSRLKQLGMTMESDVQQLIVRLSQGLPGYAHLLGQNAARAAIEKHSLKIDATFMPRAMNKAIAGCDERIQEQYAAAVRSTKPNNQYRQALLACAMAEFNERGYFTAASVKAPFSKIMGSEKGFETFNRHLLEFCSEKRGEVLTRVGSPKSYEYKFSTALMRPFVVIKGVADDLITKDDL